MPCLRYVHVPDQKTIFTSRTPQYTARCRNRHTTKHTRHTFGVVSDILSAALEDFEGISPFLWRRSIQELLLVDIFVRLTANTTCALNGVSHLKFGTCTMYMYVVGSAIALAVDRKINEGVVKL